jgi:hypothetical protein
MRCLSDAYLSWIPAFAGMAARFGKASRAQILCHCNPHCVHGENLGKIPDGAVAAKD